MRFWGVWKCTKPWHPQPCWHGRCKLCNWATAFDFSREEVEYFLEKHECRVDKGRSDVV